MAKTADPDALLCESCGYPIEDLPEEGNCPECGRPIASSLPSARPGSPWQQRPGLGSFLATNLAALRRPGPLFERIRIDWRSGIGLLTLDLLIAALVLIAPWSGTLIGDPVRAARQAHRSVLGAAWAIPLQVLAVAAVLLALTGIEWLGVQFFARSRGHRLTPAAAWQICAHASVGWVLAAAFSIVGMIIWLNLSVFGLSGFLSRYTAVSDWVLVSVPAAGAFLGLLIFEMLVYTGVNKCRFANRPRSGGA